MLEDVPELDTLDGAGGRRRPDLRCRDGGQGDEAGHRDLSARRPSSIRSMRQAMKGTNRSPQIRRSRPSPKASRSSSRARSPPHIVKALVTDILAGERSRDRTCAGHDPGNRKDRDRRRGGGGLCRGAGESGAVQGPQGRHRDVRRQYRHAPAVQRDPARTDARRPHPHPGRGDRGPARRPVAGRGAGRAMPAAISWKSPTTA